MIHIQKKLQTLRKLSIQKYETLKSKKLLNLNDKILKNRGINM